MISPNSSHVGKGKSPKSSNTPRAVATLPAGRAGKVSGAKSGGRIKASPQMNKVVNDMLRKGRAASVNGLMIDTLMEAAALPWDGEELELILPIKLNSLEWIKLALAANRQKVSVGQVIGDVLTGGYQDCHGVLNIGFEEQEEHNKTHAEKLAQQEKAAK